MPTQRELGRRVPPEWDQDDAGRDRRIDWWLAVTGVGLALGVMAVAIGVLWVWAWAVQG